MNWKSKFWKRNWASQIEMTSCKWPWLRVKSREVKQLHGHQQTAASPWTLAVGKQQVLYLSVVYTDLSLKRILWLRVMPSGEHDHL